MHELLMRRGVYTDRRVFQLGGWEDMLYTIYLTLRCLLFFCCLTLVFRVFSRPLLLYRVVYGAHARRRGRWSVYLCFEQKKWKGVVLCGFIL